MTFKKQLPVTQGWVKPMTKTWRREEWFWDLPSSISPHLWGNSICGTSGQHQTLSLWDIWDCPVPTFNLSIMTTMKSLHDSIAWHWWIPFPSLRPCLERFSLMKSSIMDSVPLAFIFMASDLSSCLNHNIPLLCGLCLLKLTDENRTEQQRSIWAQPKAAAFPTSPFCAMPQGRHSFLFFLT